MEKPLLLPTKHDPLHYGSNVNEPELSYPAGDLLKEASAIQTERGQEYDQGSEERNIGKVVKAFNAIHGTNLTESMGWHFMTLLKAVRLFSKEEFHKDSAIDMVSYASLTGEAKSEGK